MGMAVEIASASAAMSVTVNTRPPVRSRRSGDQRPPDACVISRMVAERDSYCEAHGPEGDQSRGKAAFHLRAVIPAQARDSVVATMNAAMA